MPFHLVPSGPGAGSGLGVVPFGGPAGRAIGRAAGRATDGSGCLRRGSGFGVAGCASNAPTLHTPDAAPPPAGPCQRPARRRRWRHPRADSGAAGAEGHRLGGAAVVAEGLEIDLRARPLGGAAAGGVVRAVAAVRGDAAGTIRAGGVGDNGIRQRCRANVDDAASVAEGCAIAGKRLSSPSACHSG